MKRSALPSRRAPLRHTPFTSRGTPLKRRTPIKQKAAPKGTGLKGGAADDGKEAAQRLVRRRPLNGWCEARSPWCQGRANQYSHRWHEGQGGPWTASNGLRVCGLGNAAGCHGWIHQHPIEAERLGWIVRPGPGRKVDLTKVSAYIHTRHYGLAWVFLLDDGDVALDTSKAAA